MSANQSLPIHHSTLRGSSHSLTLSQTDDERTMNNDVDEEKQESLGNNASSAKTRDDTFEVSWDENEPGNPYNWSTSFKCWVTFQLGILALAASLGSSIIAPAQNAIAEYMNISTEVTVLNVSLYVVGFAIGPLLWAPVSEIWGRKISMLPAMVCLGLFSIGSATSKNPQSLFLTRFFGGVFGSAPVSNVSAALGDIWNREVRGTAVALYAVAVVGGPTLGPTIGSALTVTINWRWTEYLEAIFVLVWVAVMFFCFPEVYGPVLLQKKAQRLRKETGNDKWHHPHEDIKFDVRSMVTKHLARPLVMLTTEPMVTCIAFYASFVYSMLYLSLEIVPIVFEEQRHWSPIVGSLPFLGLMVGVLIALVINLGNQPRYIRKVRASNGKPVPEARLPPMAIGAFLFTIGLFWFGWTGPPGNSWVLPCIATVFIGAGFNSIFQQCINFLVDTYGLYAASATAANTFLRSLMACGLPLAAKPMFHALGIGPGMSLLGGVAALAIPVPFIFMKYGLALRKKSKYAPVHE